MNNWTLLCADSHQEHLYLLKEFLESYELKVEFINKADSVFPSVGESELYVLQEDYEKALQLMEAFNPGSTR
jgi:hypothetical protein